MLSMAAHRGRRARVKRYGFPHTPPTMRRAIVYEGKSSRSLPESALADRLDDKKRVMEAKESTADRHIHHTGSGQRERRVGQDYLPAVVELTPDGFISGISR
jgi:hypothetical protein